MSYSNNLAGYGFLTILSVLLWTPFIEYMNVNLPSDSVGEALSTFFWIVYPLIIFYFIYNLLKSILE
jgi:hypothetical protein